jgi:hypothetical protein
MAGTGSVGGAPRAPGRIAGALLLALVAAAALPATAGAGDLAIDATLTPDHVTAGGEGATLSIVVRGGMNLPDAPVPRVAGLLFDPAGTAQNFSMINGRVTRSTTVTYRVEAPRAGTYVIPPLRVSQGKETAQTNPLTLTVLPPGSAVPGQPTPRPPTTREPWAGEKGPPPVFVRLVVDRDHVYWNQEIVARLRIYARVPLDGAPDWTAPGTEGFWVEDLGAPTAGSARVGSYVYVVNEIRWAMFPTKTGTLTIAPAQVRCRIDRVVPAPDPWSSLGFPDVEPQDVSLATDPVHVTVEPLPKDAPEGFSGAVGSYSLSVHVDRGTVPAGEPAIVTTTVKGEGNVASLHDPEVTAPPSARRYVANSSTQIDRSGQTLRGTRAQQVAVVSEAPGTVRVGPVRFSWFDPDDGRFHTATSESIRIHVTPAVRGAAPESGFRAPEPPAGPRTGTGPWGPLALGPPPGAVGVSGAAAAAYAALALLAAVRDRRARNPRAVRRALLDAEAARVAAARRGLAAGNAPASAARAAEALLAGLTVRYDIGEPGLARGELLREAGRRGAAEDALREAGALLDALDAISFAPPDARAADAEREMRAVEGLLSRFREEIGP